MRYIKRYNNIFSYFFYISNFSVDNTYVRRGKENILFFFFLISKRDFILRSRYIQT